MNLYGVLQFFKPYITTFANRLVNGVGFGLGMSIAWNIQSKP